jgi:hypothetical protein
MVLVRLIHGDNARDDTGSGISGKTVIRLSTPANSAFLPKGVFAGHS